MVALGEKPVELCVYRFKICSQQFCFYGLFIVILYRYISIKEYCKAILIKPRLRTVIKTYAHMILFPEDLMRCICCKTALVRADSYIFMLKPFLEPARSKIAAE